MKENNWHSPSNIEEHKSFMWRDPIEYINTARYNVWLKHDAGYRFDFIASKDWKQITVLDHYKTFDVWTTLDATVFTTQKLFDEIKSYEEKITMLQFKKLSTNQLTRLYADLSKLINRWFPEFKTANELWVLSDRHIEDLGQYRFSTLSDLFHCIQDETSDEVAKSVLKQRAFNMYQMLHTTLIIVLNSVPKNVDWKRVYRMPEDLHALEELVLLGWTEKIPTHNSTSDNDIHISYIKDRSSLD